MRGPYPLPCGTCSYSYSCETVSHRVTVQYNTPLLPWQMLEQQCGCAPGHQDPNLTSRTADDQKLPSKTLGMTHPLNPDLQSYRIRAPQPARLILRSSLTCCPCAMAPLALLLIACALLPASAVVVPLGGTSISPEQLQMACTGQGMRNVCYPVSGGACARLARVLRLVRQIPRVLLAPLLRAASCLPAAATTSSAARTPWSAAAPAVRQGGREASC